MQTKILLRVARERAKQDNKWGVQNHSLEWWYAILGEEFGEVGKAILECHFSKTKYADRIQDAKTENDVIEELLQVAAVAVATIKCIYRKRSNETETV